MWQTGHGYIVIKLASIASEAASILQARDISQLMRLDRTRWEQKLNLLVEEAGLCFLGALVLIRSTGK